MKALGRYDSDLEMFVESPIGVQFTTDANGVVNGVAQGHATDAQLYHILTHLGELKFRVEQRLLDDDIQMVGEQPLTIKDVLNAFATA